MNEFFTLIYSWFCDSSSKVFRIMDTIWDEDQEQLFSSLFPTFGIVTIAVTFLVAFAFYIWPINHPRFKAWWSWLIMLLVNAAINFGLAFVFVSHRISDIKTKEDAVEMFLAENEDTLSLSVADWMSMAWANVFVSIMFFILASLILNWFSVNCRFSPFRR